MQAPTLLLALILILQLSGLADGALSTTVESGEEECFVVRAPAGEVSTISGNFDCLDDDLEAGVVGVTLYDEKSTPVWQSYTGATEGSFSLYGSGRFELCIQNGQLGSDDKFYPKDGIAREVGFAIRVAPQSQRGMEDGKAGPDDRLTSHLLEQSAKLMDGLHTMMDHQEYMRGRENKHSVLAEMTFNRVVQWTVLEAIVLALIACGQVLYLKKFFEQRRYL